eukprot:2841891-Alexandrium_andersonii.AAC.1
MQGRLTPSRLRSAWRAGPRRRLSAGEAGRDLRGGNAPRPGRRRRNVREISRPVRGGAVHAFQLLLGADR